MKLVVLDGYTLNPGDLDWDLLKKFGDLVVYDRTSNEKIIERAKGAEIIFTNKTPLPAEVIHQLPDLKYIGVLATGYNIVDTEAASRKGVIVSNAPGYGTYSVAQSTFALLLELCHHTQRHSDSVMRGDWSRCQDWCYSQFPLVELAGKTIGIIGFGSIGQKVGDIAAAFGMNILASPRADCDQSYRSNFEWTDITELLEASDVITLHCPLTAQTAGLINKHNISKMKPSAFLVNTSRGPIINDADLADALNNDLIAGAALDVLSVEPPSLHNPLLKAKNCIITPHIAWATRGSRARLMELVVQNLAAFLNGNPVHVVNETCKRKPLID